MCTVSYCRTNNQTIISSNRDEHLLRPLALAPAKYTLQNCEAIYPVDPQAMGTWFVVKTDGTAYVLLNGAFKKHVRNEPYRKSRGLILLEIIDHTNPLENWENTTLEGIEPFTLIAFTKSALHQLRWDGLQKHNKQLPLQGMYIWSSATLYDEITIKNREQWFNDFLKEKQQKVTAVALEYFHKTTQADDNINGLVIHRPTNILTKNITQFTLNEHSFTLSHSDLITQQNHQITEFLA